MLGNAVPLLLCFLRVAQAQGSLTALPSQPANKASDYGPAAPQTLSATSRNFVYTVTTPTTIWNTPTFATPAPLPACGASLCPTNDGKECIDEAGVVYGVICNTQLSGVVITTSGKKERRSCEFLVHTLDAGLEHITNRPIVTGSVAGCLAFCDTYSSNYCMGVYYTHGDCLAYDTITGTFSDPSGGFVAIRQS